jgi:hypothetical protein
MPLTPLAPGRFILARFVKARRVAGNAPASDEGDGAGRAAHVDGGGIIEDTACPGRSDRPSAKPAIFVEPFGHWPVAGTDPISRARLPASETGLERGDASTTVCEAENIIGTQELPSSPVLPI